MKLTVGHLDYTIRPMCETDDGHGVNHGETDTIEQEIRIDADVSPGRQLEVLIHEIFHAAWDAYCGPAKATEEQAVGILGAALASVIRANKHLLPVLTALRNGVGFLGD